MKYAASLVLVCLCFGASTGLAQPAPNLLADPSFEEWAGDPSSTNWIVFNNASCVGITPRTKSWNAKMWGGFKNEENHSGIYQDVPAQEGNHYEASAYIRQNSDDHLAGDNVCWVKLEYFAADRSTRLATFESPVKMDAKSPSKKYVFISTGPTAAPKGAAWTRVVVLIRQGPDNAAGAALVDDVSLRQVP